MLLELLVEWVRLSGGILEEEVGAALCKVKQLTNGTGIEQ